jgi:hypothetical protein
VGAICLQQKVMMLDPMLDPKLGSMRARYGASNLILLYIIDVQRFVALGFDAPTGRHAHFKHLIELVKLAQFSHR